MSNPDEHCLLAATDSVKALERANKPKQKLAQERALGEVVGQCLITPFVEASVASNRTTCTALAQVRKVAVARRHDSSSLGTTAFKRLVGGVPACELGMRGKQDKKL